jgi:hypothetical protein
MDGKPKTTSFWVLKLLKYPHYNKKNLKKNLKKTSSFCCTLNKTLLPFGGADLQFSPPHDIQELAFVTEEAIQEG